MEDLEALPEGVGSSAGCCRVLEPSWSPRGDSGPELAADHM